MKITLSSPQGNRRTLEISKLVSSGKEKLIVHEVIDATQTSLIEISLEEDGEFLIGVEDSLALVHRSA